MYNLVAICLINKESIMVKCVIGLAVFAGGLLMGWGVEHSLHHDTTVAACECDDNCVCCPGCACAHNE